MNSTSVSIVYLFVRRKKNLQEKTFLNISEKSLIQFVDLESGKQIYTEQLDKRWDQVDINLIKEEKIGTASKRFYFQLTEGMNYAERFAPSKTQRNLKYIMDFQPGTDCSSPKVIQTLLLNYGDEESDEAWAKFNSNLSSSDRDLRRKEPTKKIGVSKDIHG